MSILQSLYQYTCDQPAPMSDFDLDSFAGSWYLQQQSLDPWQTQLNDCVQAQYQDINGDSFKVHNSFQRKVGPSMTPRAGLTTPGTCGTDGQCTVMMGDASTERPNLRVIDTDYESYAINYWCDDYSRYPRLWLHTRDPVPSEALYNEVYAKAMALLPSFDQSLMEKRIIQGNQCAYKADPDGALLAMFGRPDPIKVVKVAVKDTKAAAHFLAGWMYGMTGENNLDEIAGCYEHSADIAESLQIVIRGFKKGGPIWITQASLELIQLALVIPQTVQHCKNIGEDIQAIESWAMQFTEPVKLSTKVSKHMAFNALAIRKEMKSLESNIENGAHFEAGRDLASVTNMLLNGKPPRSSRKDDDDCKGKKCKDDKKQEANEPKGALVKTTHITAGLLFGMTGQNDLEQIEACFQGSQKMLNSLEQSIADFSDGGWNSITQGTIEIVQLALMIPLEMQTCSDMSDDFARVQAWGLQFTEPGKLTAEVSKHYMFNRKLVNDAIDELKLDYSEARYFETGQDLATITNLLLGGKPTSDKKTEDKRR